MYEIVKSLPGRLIGGKVRSIVSAKCLRCGEQSTLMKQNVAKHNIEKRTHCGRCVVDRYHYLTGTRIWRIWRGMKTRCQNPTREQDVRNYGGRGITVCERWQSFDNFYEDMRDGYSDDLTIERINGNKSYSKSNCRWATNMEQQSNKRNNRYLMYQGEKLHLAEVCRRSGVSKMKMLMRLNRGMNADTAVADALASRYGKSQRLMDIRRRDARMSTI